MEMIVHVLILYGNSTNSCKQSTFIQPQLHVMTDNKCFITSQHLEFSSWLNIFLDSSP